jgi:glycosyltransferase involved in cell wall biosynthesis
MTVKFAFAIPTRNSTKTLEKTLVSLAGQSYEGWRAVIVDDCSTDGTKEKIADVANGLGILDKLTLIRNEERSWEIVNTIKALEKIQPDEIVCRLDLDDYLCDLNALEIIARRYAKDPELDALWTAHRWFDKNGITTMNISGPMPQGADPYKHPWVSSHLKTFRRSLLAGVSDANYRGKDNEYFKRIGDQTFMLPALARARKHEFLPIAAYAYFCPMDPGNFQTDDAKFQKEEADYLRARGFVK